METDIYIITSRTAPRPGPGEYISVLEYKLEDKEYTKTLRKQCEEVTPHALELTALSDSLNCVRRSCDLRSHSTHGWVKSIFLNGWIGKWKAAGWVNNGKPVANTELYELIDRLTNDNGLNLVSFDDDLGSYRTWLTNEIRR